MGCVFVVFVVLEEEIGIEARTGAVSELHLTLGTSGLYCHCKKG